MIQVDMQMAESPLGSGVRVTENNMEIKNNGHMEEKLDEFKQRKNITDEIQTISNCQSISPVSIPY